MQGVVRRYGGMVALAFLCAAGVLFLATRHQIELADALIAILPALTFVTLQQSALLRATEDRKQLDRLHREIDDVAQSRTPQANVRPDDDTRMRMSNRALMELAVRLKEHDLHVAEFQRAISPAIAREMIESSKQVLGGKEIRGAILFLDIRGFTTIVQRREPAETMSILNTFFTHAVPLIERNGGVIDKFVGDGVMALFGIPRSLGNNALCAIDASIELQALSKRLNAEGAFGEGVQLEIGIGVAKGKVIAGNVGAAHRYSYTAIGATVNLAARLCAYAMRGQVLCCNFSYLDVKDFVQTSRLSSIQLKGIDTPINTYEIQGWLGKKPSARHFQSDMDSAATVRRASVDPLVQNIERVQATEMASRVTRRLIDLRNRSAIQDATNTRPITSKLDLEEGSLNGEAKTDFKPGKATKELGALATEASMKHRAESESAEAGATREIKRQKASSESGGFVVAMVEHDSTHVTLSAKQIADLGRKEAKEREKTGRASTRIYAKPITETVSVDSEKLEPVPEEDLASHQLHEHADLLRLDDEHGVTTPSMTDDDEKGDKSTPPPKTS